MTNYELAIFTVALGIIIFLAWISWVICIFSRKNKVTNKSLKYDCLNELPNDAENGSISFNHATGQLFLKSQTGWTEVIINPNHHYNPYPALGGLMEFEYKGVVHTYDGKQWSRKNKGDNHESLEQTRST